MNIEKLIAEVEKRPILYDYRLAGYSRKELKPRLWHEVSKIVSAPDWELLSHQEQLAKVVEVQKRWRTLRDNFKRELNYQRAIENGEITSTVKKKKYLYFDLLHFLEPVMDKARLSNVVKEEYFPTEEETSEDSNQIFFEPKTNSTSSTSNGINSTFNDYTTPSTEFQSNQLCFVQQDSDHLFLMSLLPVLNNMQDHQKSLAKLRIMQVLHEISYGMSNVTSSSHSIGPIIINCPQNTQSHTKQSQTQTNNSDDEDDEDQKNETTEY